MEQKDYWDSVSDAKEFTTPFQSNEFAKYLDLDSVILDVGCGYGRTLDELHRLGYRHMIGMDFSQGMIERGKQQTPYLDLRLKKGPEIDLPDSSVDAVILFAVLTCIKSDGEQKALISEISRVLKPEGILYVNDFIVNSDERNQARYRCFEERYGIYGIFELPEGAVLRHHSEEWIEELLADFFTLKYEHLTFTTMNGNTSNGFYFIGRKPC